MPGRNGSIGCPRSERFPWAVGKAQVLISMTPRNSLWPRISLAPRMFSGAVPHGTALLGWEECDLACRRACHQLPNSGLDGGVSMTCTDTVPQGTAFLGRGGMRRGMPMGMPPASFPRAPTGVCMSPRPRKRPVTSRCLTVRPVTSRA